jgi:FMN phosphatase YigB (HAD superfamily)
MKKIELVIFDLDDTLFDTTGTLDHTYKGLPDIRLFPGVKDILKKMSSLSIPKILATRGDSQMQHKKIDILGVREDFNKIVICSTDEEKHTAFTSVISDYGIKDPSLVLVVGNRIDSEIRYGNMLGCTTIHIKHGRYAELVPKDSFEIPHITVLKTSDIAAYF